MINTIKKPLDKLMAPSFFDVHHMIKNNEYTHYWLKGGRGSTKSSFISIEIIIGIKQDKNANCVAIRKGAINLKDSVYNQLVWAIDILGMTNEFITKVSPMEIIYKPTGQRIIFRGADKPQKLKSTKVSKGYIKYIWYEELDEFGGIDEIDVINQSLIRGGNNITVFYSYNPPHRQSNWVNEAATTIRSDRLIHHSDYTQVQQAHPEWLGENFIAEAEQMKRTNITKYNHDYLGEVTGTGAEVFVNITSRSITNDEINSFDKIKRGIDWGYGADPFVYLAMYYDKKCNKLYIFHEFYKTAAKFDLIAEEIKKENRYNEVIIAESAEPRSNDELRARGLSIRAAKKTQGSVEHGVKWLQDLNEIIIDPQRCPNTKREFNGYELERDNNNGFKAGFPDKNNHTIDTVRYALEDYIGKRGKILFA